MLYCLMFESTRISKRISVRITTTSPEEIRNVSQLRKRKIIVTESIDYQILENISVDPIVSSISLAQYLEEENISLIIGQRSRYRVSK